MKKKKGIIVLSDSEGIKINPETGNKYTKAEIEAANTVVSLPISGREYFPKRE